MLAIEAKIKRMKRESQEFREVLQGLEVAIENHEDRYMHTTYGDDLTESMDMLKLMGYTVEKCVEDDDYVVIEVSWLGFGVRLEPCHFIFLS